MPNANPLIEDLELRINNPYSVGNIFSFLDGDFLLDREAITVEKSIRDQYHVVVEDQTIWAIAFKYYGNSKEWWIISDVNDIKWPFKLDSGTVLLIPDINTVKISL